MVRDEVGEGRRTQTTLFPAWKNFGRLVNKTIYLSLKCTCHIHEGCIRTVCNSRCTNKNLSQWRKDVNFNVARLFKDQYCGHSFS